MSGPHVVRGMGKGFPYIADAQLYADQHGVCGFGERSEAHVWPSKEDADAWLDARRAAGAPHLLWSEPATDPSRHRRGHWAEHKGGDIWLQYEPIPRRALPDGRPASSRNHAVLFDPAWVVTWGEPDERGECAGRICRSWDEVEAVLRGAP